MQKEQNDEIDLLSLIQTIWDGKWIIIIATILTTIIGILYIISIPSSYEIKSTITNDKQNIFIKYKSVNDILKETNMYPSVNISETFQINGDVILEMFFNEFNDYEEMINVLKENKFVSDKIKNVNDYEARKILVSYSNKFKIVKPVNKHKDYKINFRWHDVDEGTLLIDRAFQITLKNVKEKLLIHIKSLASSIDYKNQRIKNSLTNKLKTNKEVYDLSIAKRKLYLTENSKVAKELGIEQSISFVNKDTSNILLMSENYPYYLRGYKAIDKEIDLIEKRSEKENSLMTNGYIETTKKLMLIEKDNKSNDLRNAAKFIVGDNIKNWINFNLEFAKVKNLKKQNLYFLISVFLGLFIGVFYVLLAKSLRERTKIVDNPN